MRTVTTASAIASFALLVVCASLWMLSRTLAGAARATIYSAIVAFLLAVAVYLSSR